VTNYIVRYTESMVKKATKKVVKKSASTEKVDYWPNRMSLAVAALSAVTLVLLAVIAIYS
jgi:hypothetical protein